MTMHEESLPADARTDEKWGAYHGTVLEFGGDEPLRVDLRRPDLPALASRLRALGLEPPVAILTAENDRLAEENARLRALLTPAGLNARAEVEQQMKALQRALLPLLEPAKAQWQADKRSRPLRHQ